MLSLNDLTTAEICWLQRLATFDLYPEKMDPLCLHLTRRLQTKGLLDYDPIVDLYTPNDHGLLLVAEANIKFGPVPHTANPFTYYDRRYRILELIRRKKNAQLPG